MSYGTLGADAIPDRLMIEYAPTGRASCKACGGALPQDEAKVGEKVRSPWHDGFDVKWYHPRCCVRILPKSVHELKGFQRLRWKDQLALFERLRPELKDEPQPAEVKRLNEMVWEVRGRLEKVPKNALRELIEANGVYVSDKATPPAMLHGIADGLVCGKLPPCPWCSGHSLELEGTLVRCCARTPRRCTRTPPTANSWVLAVTSHSSSMLT
jgi:poly [ADP-ribose] polymerase